MGIMEKKMETTIVYRDYIEIMEKKMETIEIIAAGLALPIRILALCLSAEDMGNCCSASTPAWASQVCRLRAFWPSFSGFGLLFYLLLGFR